MKKEQLKEINHLENLKSIWNLIKDTYEVDDWENCKISILERAEKREINMKNAYNLIYDLVRLNGGFDKELNVKTK